MSIGKQIKKYRIAARLKQVQLAELSGIDNGTISAQEVRDSEASRHLPQFAAAFGLTVDQLLDEETDYSTHVCAFVEQALAKGSIAQPARHTAQEKTPAAWARPDAYWPFSIEKERVRAALLPEDLARASAYLQAIVETRESEAIQTNVKNTGTKNASRP